MKKYEEEIRYLMRRVNKTENECWEWVGSSNRGYGDMNKYGHRLAHRFSWYIHNGEIPEGMFVLHRCDNPRCANPNHLFLGSQKDNMEDMARKGRAHRATGPKSPHFGKVGSAHPNASLTRDEFYLMNIMIGMRTKKKDIADYFGISRQTVRNLSKRESY